MKKGFIFLIALFLLCSVNFASTEVKSENSIIPSITLTPGISGTDYVVLPGKYSPAVVETWYATGLPANCSVSWWYRTQYETNYNFVGNGNSYTRSYSFGGYTTNEYHYLKMIVTYSNGQTSVIELAINVVDDQIGGI